MAKTVWKYFVPLGPISKLQLTGPLLPHVELTTGPEGTGLNVWAENSFLDPYTVQLRVVLTGEVIPESWIWIATARGDWGSLDGFVGHLYQVSTTQS